MSQPVKAWLISGQPAVIADLTLLPKADDQQATVPLFTSSQESLDYQLLGEDHADWILKKFQPEYEPEFRHSDLIQDLVPRMAGFESGYSRRVLNYESLSTEGYFSEEFQHWLHGAILVPQVRAPKWTTVIDSIMEGGEVLSKIVRLMLCEKLSQCVEWLESLGLANRRLSGWTVLIDPVNIEVHFVNWDEFYHPTKLRPPVRSTLSAPGYTAPFIRLDQVDDETWRPHSDRFALAALNTEILLMKSNSQRVSNGGLFDQKTLNERAGQSLSHVRSALQKQFPEAARLLDQSLTAASFDQCPSPSDWLNFISHALNDDAEQSWEQHEETVSKMQSIYERPRELGFVSVNEFSFTKVNWQGFVASPRKGRTR